MKRESAQTLLELLLITSYLDGRLSAPENEVIESGLSLLGWEPGDTATVDVALAHNEATRVMQNVDGIESAILERAGRLRDEGLGLVAFTWLSKTLHSDGLGPSEHYTLTRLEKMLVG